MNDKWEIEKSHGWLLIAALIGAAAVLIVGGLQLGSSVADGGDGRETTVTKSVVTTSYEGAPPTTVFETVATQATVTEQETVTETTTVAEEPDTVTLTVPTDSVSEPLSATESESALTDVASDYPDELGAIEGNIFTERASVNGREYDHVVRLQTECGAHGATFNLGRRYEALSATIGFTDDAVDLNGRYRFRMYVVRSGAGDEELAFDRMIPFGRYATVVGLPMNDVLRLRIEIEPLDAGCPIPSNQAYQAAWADATLVGPAT